MPTTVRRRVFLAKRSSQPRTSVLMLPGFTLGCFLTWILLCIATSVRMPRCSAWTRSLEEAGRWSRRQRALRTSLGQLTRASQRGGVGEKVDPKPEQDGRHHSFSENFVTKCRHEDTSKESVGHPVMEPSPNSHAVFGNILQNTSMILITDPGRICAMGT